MLHCLKLFSSFSVLLFHLASYLWNNFLPSHEESQCLQKNEAMEGADEWTTETIQILEKASPVTLKISLRSVWNER